MARTVITADPGDELLTPREAAAVLFGVARQTLHRWEREGRLGEGTVIRTPGGALRYKAAAIRALRAGALSGEGSLGGRR